MPWLSLRIDPLQPAAGACLPTVFERENRPHSCAIPGYLLAGRRTPKRPLAATYCASDLPHAAFSVRWPSSAFRLGIPNCHSNPTTQRVRRKRQRLPPSLLIENASDAFLAFQRTACPRRFRSRLSDHTGVAEQVGRVSQPADSTLLQRRFVRVKTKI